ncbi:Transcription factor [Nymphaea thermarum]|nr:Transcription factor [Nymphaea thermarum]
MEGGSLQLLNCALQCTLRSLCGPESQWVYAVFWRILPRNYPPPKWDSSGNLDRSKENKRNWILLWEDGFCNFRQCQQASRESPTKFGAGIFFKLSYEVYNYGEGLVGKVAADYGHKYIYRDGSSTKEPHSVYSWSSSVDPLPRAWEPQFRSGIKTIALVAVREGVVQLGSLEKVAEDLNLVISIQRKFNYLHSIPGVFAVQRPFLTPPLPYNTMVVGSGRPNLQFLPSPFTEVDHFESREYETKPGASQLLLGKRWCMEQPSPSKAINLGWNGPRTLASPAPLLPSMTSGLGNVFSPAPPVNHHEALQSPVGAMLGEVRRGATLEIISSVKPEPRTEDLEELNVRAPSTSNLGTGARWIIQ